MSVLINMEMPTHCMDCPFMVSRDNDDCILQSDEANANFKDWDDMKASCPLVSVPPHGRLIDADALMELIKAHDYPLRAHFNSTDNGMFTIGIQQAVDELPTIIPAEEGE